MGRFETERQNFIRAYTRLLVSSWSDDLYLQRLLASPRDVLAEAGLEIPASVVIRVERQAAPVPVSSSSEEALNVQVNLWFMAEERGELVLYVPDATTVTTEDLDQSDLAGVSGGEAAWCCCCPCSTCA